MSGRTHILDNLRKAERTGCARPEVPSNADLFTLPEGDLADVFQQQLERLSGEVVRVANVDEATDALERIIGDSRAMCDGSSALNPLANALPVAGSENNAAMAQVEFGVTGADALVARTGSVILSSSVTGGRRLSVLPPTHVVIAWTSQIVPTLSDVPLLPETGSTRTIISGPSRTADIEKILVLGAHGPKRLVVILVDGSPYA